MVTSSKLKTDSWLCVGLCAVLEQCRCDVHQILLSCDVQRRVAVLYTTFVQLPNRVLKLFVITSLTQSRHTSNAVLSCDEIMQPTRFRVIDLQFGWCCWGLCTHRQIWTLRRYLRIRFINRKFFTRVPIFYWTWSSAV